MASIKGGLHIKISLGNTAWLGLSKQINKKQPTIYENPYPTFFDPTSNFCLLSFSSSYTGLAILLNIYQIGDSLKAFASLLCPCLETSSSTALHHSLSAFSQEADQRSCLRESFPDHLI